MAPSVDIEGNASLHDGSIRNSGRVGMVHLLYASVYAYGVSANDERTLSLSVDLAISPVERGHEEKAAFETARISG